MSKSYMVGINIEELRVSELANMVGCRVAQWPIKYLGLPLGGGVKVYIFLGPGSGEGIKETIMLEEKVYIIRGLYHFDKGSLK